MNKIGKYKVNDSVLNIINVDEIDFGVYHCIASYKIIEVDSIFNYVLKADRGSNETFLNEITGNGALIKVGENKKLTLECRFTNAHTITWRLIEKQINNRTKG